MEIYFATGNPAKFNHVEKSLSDYGIRLIRFEEEIPEPRDYNIEEVARHKVMIAYKKLGKPVIAQDSGFSLNAYSGFPGPFVNPALEKLGLKGILKLIDGEDRGCEFRMVLAYMDKELDEPITFESTAAGALSESPKGEYLPDLHLSKLSEIFIPDGYEKTHAEMTEKEFKEWRGTRKNVSHVSKFVEWLLKERLTN